MFVCLELHNTHSVLYSFTQITFSVDKTQRAVQNMSVCKSSPTVLSPVVPVVSFVVTVSAFCRFKQRTKIKPAAKVLFKLFKTSVIM